MLRAMNSLSERNIRKKAETYLSGFEGGECFNSLTEAKAIKKWKEQITKIHLVVNKVKREYV